MSYIRIKLSNNKKYLHIYGNDDKKSYMGRGSKNDDGRWSFTGFQDPPPFATLEVMLSWAQYEWIKYEKRNTSGKSAEEIYPMSFLLGL